MSSTVNVNGNATLAIGNTTVSLAVDFGGGFPQPAWPSSVFNASSIQSTGQAVLSNSTANLTVPSGAVGVLIQGPALANSINTLQAVLLKANVVCNYVHPQAPSIIWFDPNNQPDTLKLSGNVPNATGNSVAVTYLWP